MRPPGSTERSTVRLSSPPKPELTPKSHRSLSRAAVQGALNGPISNFSAKGKTGNTLPDGSDVTGRSGEGRTGKSHGELVEDTARGNLGGRKTPTRITKEPFEQQYVKEQKRSSDPL